MTPTQQSQPTVDAVRNEAGAATALIAPLWPLSNFVAVNPFLGLADRSLPEAAAIMGRAAGARMALPRQRYLAALEEGRITDADLLEAIARLPEAPKGAADPAAAKAALRKPAAAPQPLPTVAETAGEAKFVVERISAWAAAHFDRGQASWASPFAHMAPFEAWRAEALIDRTPEVHGMARFRSEIAAMPERPEEMLAEATARVGLSEDELTPYFHRLLMSVGGWAGYVAHLDWEDRLYGRPADTLAGLLAILAAWEAYLLPRVPEAWTRSRDAATWAGPAEEDRWVDAVWQGALEAAWQRQFLGRLHGEPSVASLDRPAVQAAFCIDVRSEVFRRAMEAASPTIQTIGFAGFFGYPIEYVPIGQAHGGAQCPVLLTPKFVVQEGIAQADIKEEEAILGRRVLSRRAARAWKSFKLAAVSSFAFVETLGLTYAAKLVTDAFRLTRPVPHPSSEGLGAAADRLTPRIDAGMLDGRETGFTQAQMIDMSQAVLTGMSLKSDFARLVLLAGHGSSTVNNPHATGLDCGACGGHTGEANARVAAAILNRPEVRTGLAERGIAIPEDTFFLGGLHDTTTDEMALFGADAVPQSHAADLVELRKWLAEAGRAARAERAGTLHLPAGAPVDAQIMARARDWAQVRPEWGLAGCAAFVAAPRHRTAGCDLGGRAFLQSYDWEADDGFGVLTLIMTAPMVVASWISLQYYGSSVDNQVFGSGNKVLHNVTGLLGVAEGNGGDLRSGLPWQSVHDGRRLLHEPLRLSVIIEAPTEAMNDVIAAHRGVADLLDNGWLHLFAMDAEGAVSHRYVGGLQWEETGEGLRRAA